MFVGFLASLLDFLLFTVAIYSKNPLDFSLLLNPEKRELVEASLS